MAKFVIPLPKKVASSYNQQVVDMLMRLGKDIVYRARASRHYKDRSGHLRTSHGIAVYYNDKLIESSRWHMHKTAPTTEDYEEIRYNRKSNSWYKKVHKGYNGESAYTAFVNHLTPSKLSPDYAKGYTLFVVAAMYYSIFLEEGTIVNATKPGYRVLAGALPAVRSDGSMLENFLHKTSSRWKGSYCLYTYNNGRVQQASSVKLWGGGLSYGK